MDRRLFMSLLLGSIASPAWAATAERWQTLPPTPPAIPEARANLARVHGITLYYSEIGQGAPVVMLHGGLANSDYFGHQVPVLARNHRVILVDSRGHGRSARSAEPFGYDLMTNDVISLLDVLGITRASVVG